MSFLNSKIVLVYCQCNQLPNLEKVNLCKRSDIIIDTDESGIMDRRLTNFDIMSSCGTFESGRFIMLNGYR